MTTFTREQIEQWLSALGKEAKSRQYADAYKLGFQMALVAIRCRMDDARRKPAAITRNFEAKPLQEDLDGRN